MQGSTGIHHVAVSVPDIDIARRFYVDLLGAEEVSALEWEKGATAIDEIVGIRGTSGRQFMARLGNAYIEAFEYLTPRAAPQEARRPVNLFGYTHFALEVPDIDAVYKRMLAAGISFHTPPRHVGETEHANGRKQGFKATYGRDFFGNVFELLEINDGSAIKPL